MAAFGNAVISVMRILGERNIAAACRRYAAQLALALAAFGIRENVYTLNLYLSLT